MVGSEASVLSYFWQAGPVVKSVMAILLAASISSWTIIFQRAWFFKNKDRQAKSFLKQFWKSNDLSRLYADISAKDEEPTGLAAMFQAGFGEYVRARQKGALSLPPMQRVMQIEQAKEEEEMEKHLAFLATVGSIAPYVGLFGTVWGIMTSFQALGHAQQATIAMVAPGISEALVATALGLFTAIPAVLAYNRYSVKSNHIAARYSLFQEEFVSLIEQQAMPKAQGEASCHA